MSMMSNALPKIASSLQRNVPLVTKSEKEDEKANRRQLRSRRQGSKSADPKLSETKRRIEVQNAILQNAECKQRSAGYYSVKEADICWILFLQNMQSVKLLVLLDSSHCCGMPYKPKDAVRGRALVLAKAKGQHSKTRERLISTDPPHGYCGCSCWRRNTGESRLSARAWRLSWLGVAC